MLGYLRMILLPSGVEIEQPASSLPASISGHGPLGCDAAQSRPSGNLTNEVTKPLQIYIVSP
jgi:hypothetical protein